MSIVFIISAPSGSGKSTLVGRLFRDVPGLSFSVSYTTREPRGNEVDGVDYHFISREEFARRLDNNEFLEHANVFGNYYGTHRSAREIAEMRGVDLVLDIDVQGAAQLRETLPDAVTIFVLAPSREILEKRLRARSEDPDSVITRRLHEAASEIRNYRQYDYVVINDDLDSSAKKLAAIVEAERVRRSRIEDEIRPILETFEDKVER
ncbi:MAG: guanylate kinase [Bryobacterales bacterium]|nr:guanylate kinase [Bryobacterales bacterium]